MKIADKITEKEAGMLLDALKREWERYANLAIFALEERKIQDNLIHTSVSFTYCRAKWMVEDWLDTEIEQAGEDKNESEVCH